jgi:hypothetical protein
MSIIYLCSKAKCCPYVREDIKKKKMHIIDGKKDIIFNEIQVEELTKYLNKRK